jgi:hypothetical protein
MIGRLAVRSLTAHPVRSAVLAAGFGVGVSVMAILLGVAEIVLDQARSPALVGGGDVVVRLGEQVPARLLLAGTLQTDALRSRIRVASPWHDTRLYLLHDGRSVEVNARGGIPSLERAMGDEETGQIASWLDTAEDVAWTNDTPDKVLRQIDRFHEIPDAPAWASSWAEWLYFNGRADGARFYLTFLVGPALEDGRRVAGVRLQLERNGAVETFSAGQAISEAAVLQAPDLTIGASSVTLDGLVYRVHLDLRGERGRRVVGDLTIQATPGRLVPPLEITGARGWRTGYVVPVMSGALGGQLEVAGERVSLDGGSGYHDHNWGFWQGVSWQWGQVQQGDLSLLYGRVFPPADAADPDRIPGFVGVLGPDGPLAYATNVTISETNDPRGRPQRIDVQARGSGIDVRIRFDVASAVTTRMAQGPLNSGLDFLQLRGQYTVRGRAGGRTLDFTAPGAAETFRGAAAEARPQ